MRLSIAKKPRAFLDVETTGLDPLQNEILELAVVIDDPDKMPVSDKALAKIALLTEMGFEVEHTQGCLRFQAKFKPKHIETAHPKALEVNGYTPEKWKDAIEWDAAAPVLHDLLKHCVCIGHNIGFDMGFIQAALRAAGIKGWLDYHKVDTAALAYEHLVCCGLQNLKLVTICKFLGICTEGAHTSMADTIMARKVYYRLYQASWWDRLRWRLHVPAAV